MPEFLIVAATTFETDGLARHFGIARGAGDGLLCAGAGISILTTGVGMVNTAYALGRCSGNFDAVINTGICGAFDRSLQIGEVVLVASDTLSEMGAEDGEDFLDYPALNLGGTNHYAHRPAAPLPAALQPLRQVSGITVNKVHGHGPSIGKVTTLFHPQVESMEGAAFFRACAHLQAPCLQIRAVSNYVEKRDKSKWNIPLALANLNHTLIQTINELNA